MSDSTTATVATRRSAADSIPSASNAVLPTPGSPRTTSTPLSPARTASSNWASAARSARRSSITALGGTASADSALPWVYATGPELTALAAHTLAGAAIGIVAGSRPAPGALVEHASADDPAPGHLHHDGGRLHRGTLTGAGQRAGGQDQGQQ